MAWVKEAVDCIPTSAASRIYKAIDLPRARGSAGCGISLELAKASFRPLGSEGKIGIYRLVDAAGSQSFHRVQ